MNLTVLTGLLKETRIQIDTVKSGQDGIKKVCEEKYDCIFIDHLMPNMDGVETLTRMRERDDNKNKVTPYIALTANALNGAREQYLGLGFDDYISKPFSPKILVARVEAILRRSGAVGGDDVLKAGAVEIDKAAHQVKIDGNLVELSFKEFELLTYFVENQGIALSREKILNSVWNYDYFGDARTIDTHVKKLRAKMGDRGSYIKTIWGMGYKFDTTEEEQ
jgi:DNA-binding response OmpR family regulator